MTTRTVLLLGDAPPPRTTPGGLFGPGGSVRSITHPARVLELLRGVLRGQTGQLGFDGGDHQHAVVLEPGRAGANTLEARLLEAENVPEGPPGRALTIWYGLPTGILGFRFNHLGGSPTRLTLDLPQSVIRYSRRATPRYGIRVGTAPTIAFPMTDETEVECRDVLEISTGGLSLVMPPGIELAVGNAVHAVLRLRSEKALAVDVACRHVRPHDATRARVGLEFLGRTRVLELAIERYVQKMGLRSLEEEIPRQLQVAVSQSVPRAAPGAARV